MVANPMASPASESQDERRIEAKMEIKERFGYVEEMPEGVRCLYVELCEDVSSLRHKWQFYLELFANRENAVLLANLTRASFYILGELLGDGITMAICRLEDPARQGKFKNLTIEGLKESCSSVPKIVELCERFLKPRASRFATIETSALATPTSKQGSTRKLIPYHALIGRGS